MRATLGAGDALLLGTDLVKPVDRLIAAYDDAAGVTAAFDKNVLTVINRDLGGDFDLDAFEHEAVWDADARAHRDAAALAARAGRAGGRAGPGRAVRPRRTAAHRDLVQVPAETVAGELAAAGLRLTHWWTDPAGDFALSLSTPA